MQSGKHRKLVDDEKFTHEELLLMDEQDAAYLTHKQVVEQKVHHCERTPLSTHAHPQRRNVFFLKKIPNSLVQKVERLKGSLHGLTSSRPNKHIVFVDTPDEVQSFDPVQYFDTLPETVSR